MREKQSRKERDVHRVATRCSSSVFIFLRSLRSSATSRFAFSVSSIFRSRVLQKNRYVTRGQLKAGIDALHAKIDLWYRRQHCQTIRDTPLVRRLPLRLPALRKRKIVLGIARRRVRRVLLTSHPQVFFDIGHPGCVYA